jgi:acetylglutamate kinase
MRKQPLIVVKYGGAAMVNEKLKASFAQDIARLSNAGWSVIVVHGGGKEITETAAELGIETKFVNGLRYTDAAMIDVVKMVLIGKTNKSIVSALNLNNINAVGISGIDNRLLLAKKVSTDGFDYGFVGEVKKVNVDLLRTLLNDGILPVIAPVGVDKSGQAYNINADTAAAAIAVALHADSLIYLSDVEGVLDNGKVVTTISPDEAEGMIAAGVISGGMIPKVKSAFDAIEKGVGTVQMLDGRVSHVLLKKLISAEPHGTEIVPAVVTL